jgi:DNA-binding transcriptional regulator LsrR (DeoR family)
MFIFHINHIAARKAYPHPDVWTIEHTCSIELTGLQEMVQWGVPVVVIASEEEKAEIARAAIKGGYANVFIINDGLAQAMLDLRKGDESPPENDD